ncbi:MAG: 3-oxoacyl-[acyl-carrier-protein] synthase III C-terminal domain-containing protein [Schwartzia sp. (in: firmicutes)]
MAAAYMGERRCRKQMKLTGIERRHVSPFGQKMSDLCFPPAKQLMEHLGWAAEEVKVLVLVSQHPNYVLPSTSYLLQKLLGISSDCIVFDVNLGCSGFNAGLYIVASLLQQMPAGTKGVCMQGDMAYGAIRPDVSPDDMATLMLFGSAGSVVALEKVEEADPIPVAIFSDGDRYGAILRKHDETIRLDGACVFNFSVNDVTQSVVDFFRWGEVDEQMIDFYVFHQAQKLILDSMAAVCRTPEGKELRSLADYGNTSGASIPLSICVNRDRLTERSIVRFFTCGFGVGLSWSMGVISVEAENILPIIVSDEIFEG